MSLPTTNGKPPVIRNAFIDEHGRINGQVFNDLRFSDGDWITTTIIQTAKTKNTEYAIEFK